MLGPDSMLTQASERIVSGLWHHLTLPPPVLAFVTASQLPPDYRCLLDHRGGMTATLERRWGDSLVVELLADDIATQERALFRFVVLRTQKSGVAVELATIRIPLDRFPALLRTRFIEGRRPFGALLAEAGIAFRAEPVAFFRIAADELVADKAGVAVGTTLYGRVNRLLGASEEVLCETAEILPRA